MYYFLKHYRTQLLGGIQNHFILVRDQPEPEIANEQRYFVLYIELKISWVIYVSAIWIDSDVKCSRKIQKVLQWRRAQIMFMVNSVLKLWSDQLHNMWERVTADLCLAHAVEWSLRSLNLLVDRRFITTKYLDLSMRFKCVVISRRIKDHEKLYHSTFEN